MIITNAYLSIIRAKGRNILIAIIIFTIAVSSCIALAIKNAANEAENTGLESKVITGSISVDRQKMMSEMQGSFSSGERNSASGANNNFRSVMQQYQELSLEELLKYSESDYVKDFYYTSSTSLNTSGDVEPYSTESSDSSNDNESPQNQSGNEIGGGRVIRNLGTAMGDINITGYNSENAMTDFMNGNSKITEGEMFNTEESDMNCLVSYEFSIFNGLSVGDKINLSNPNNDEELYTLTIIGIYTNSAATNSSGAFMNILTSMDPANLICVSYPTLSSIITQSKLSAIEITDEMGNSSTSDIREQTNGTYVFANKEDYENFGSSLSDLGLSEYYTLSSMDIENYEASLLPLKNLSSFATILLYIILAVGGIILIVLNIFNIRERKYEVGVLTAIGIKKYKVVLQFVTELLTVSIITIIIGSGIGALASVPVSNAMLASQIESQEASEQSQEQNFGRDGRGINQNGGGPVSVQGGGNLIINNFFGGSSSPVDYVNTVNATVNFVILLQLMGIGILLTVVSSIAGIIFVIRYEPLKILADR